LSDEVVVLDENITPWLQSVVKGLDDKAPMEEIGEKMVTMVRESHTGQRGVSDGRPYAPLSERYAARKAKVGGSPKILVGPSPGGKTSGGGSLLSSWRRLRTTATGTSVGAGGARNRRLASAHDGGLADRLGRPELNRLRIGWPPRKLEEFCKLWMDRLFERGARA